MYIKNHRVPRFIRLDQANCLIGHQVRTFCNRNNIEIFEAPVNDHRAIGFIEKLIQTIMNRFACIKEEKSANNSLNIKHALNMIVHQCEYLNRKRQRSRPSKHTLVESLIPP